MPWVPPLTSNNIKKTWGKAVRKTALIGYRRIAKRTPVDLGTAQGNWHIALGKLDSFLDLSLRRTQPPKLTQAEAESFQPIFIQNCLLGSVPLS